MLCFPDAHENVSLSLVATSFYWNVFWLWLSWIDAQKLCAHLTNLILQLWIIHCGINGFGIYFSPTRWLFFVITHWLKLLTLWSEFLTHSCSCYFFPAFLHHLLIFLILIYFLYAFIYCVYSFLCYFCFNNFCNVFSSVLIFFQSTVHFMSFCRF